jgi:protoporphyrinogen IX oxidase
MDLYVTLKSLHLIFMVTWFAGLFYLPRLFVYHAMTKDKAGKERFVIMERKLLFGITTPGGVLTIIFGIWLWLQYDHVALWLSAKMVLVIFLVMYHIYCGKFYLYFKNNKNERSHTFFRWFNEIPVVILVLTVFLVVVKPGVSS